MPPDIAANQFWLPLPVKQCKTFSITKCMMLTCSLNSFVSNGSDYRVTPFAIAPIHSDNFYIILQSFLKIRTVLCWRRNRTALRQGYIQRNKYNLSSTPWWSLTVHLWRQLYELWMKVDYIVSGYCFQIAISWELNITIILCSLLSLFLCNEGDSGKEGF